ncbi:MAG: hypothetical protein GY803_15250, partial [Chloroflexi bacterium]|nr:hypothetical protein [Chloroflexota bacterium]
AGGVAGGVAFVFSYLRLYLYIFQVPWHWLAARQAAGQPARAYHLLQTAPVYWDELIWFPLLGLDRHLVALAQHSRRLAAEEIARVAGSFRQGWAAGNALLEITALDVEAAQDLPGIAKINEKLAWLPAELSGDLETFLPALRAIGSRVVSAQQSGDLANQLEQIQRAVNETSALRQSQALNQSRRAGPRFARALAVWDRVLRERLTRLKTKYQQDFIPNAYVSGAPLIDESKVFRGRREIFAALERELAVQPQQRPTLLLFGARRSGKTSVLRQLPSRLGPDFIPVEIDLLSAVTSENVTGLMQGIANQIVDRALVARRVKLARLEPETLAKDPYRVFLEWLKGQEKLLNKRLIMLNLDEYERLEEMIEDGRIDRRVFQWLRSLIQNHPQVVVLLSGSHTLEELSPAWSDALINVRTLRIGPLAENEARELITAPVEDFPLRYDEAAVENILQATGKKPYLVQAVCRDLVNHLNIEKRRFAAVQDVETAFDAVLQTGSGYFNEIWTSRDSGDEQRAILRLLSTPEHPLISEGDLVQNAKLTSLTPLRKLIWRDVIGKHNNGYRLTAPLIGRWIRERAI